MAQTEKPTNIMGIIGDVALTALAVAVIGITFSSLSRLTPRSDERLATKGQAVLGVNTAQQALAYYPANVSTLPYIQNLNLSRPTDDSGDATFVVKFSSSLEASPYRFTMMTIKNPSSQFKKLQLTPSYSLDGSYTSVSVIYAGMETEVLAVNGTVTPVDIEVPPNSSSDFAIKIQPATRLNTPVTLTFDFTEVR